MEHSRPTDTPLPSEAAAPPVSHQAPLPSMDERTPQLSLFGVTSVLEVIAALATACAQPRAHEESGDGVAWVEPGSREAVGRWGKEMEELATEVVRSLQDRRRAMEELEELRKEQRLAAEYGELSEEHEKAFFEARIQGAKSFYGCEVNMIMEGLEKIQKEREELEGEVERVGKLFDSMEREAEKLVVTLAARVIDGGKWMGTGARRSVAVAGVKVEVKVEVDEVEVDDVKVETECAEEVAKD